MQEQLWFLQLNIHYIQCAVPLEKLLKSQNIST